MLRKIIKLIIILTFPVNNIFAADIPIIVVAPGKSVQSYGTVGSSVSILNEKILENSDEFFLGDILPDMRVLLFSSTNKKYSMSSEIAISLNKCQS